MDNYGFWCDGISAEDMCNKVYDALRKNVIALKTNTMIVFTYGDCWSFLDLNMDSLLRIKNFFDASFVEVGCENKKQLRMIKRSNKKYPVAQKAVYKLDYSDDDKLKKSILMPEYFEEINRKDIVGYGVVKRELAESSNVNKYQRSILSRNIGIGCISKENMDIVREELVNSLDVEFYSKDHITTTDGTCIRFFQLENENVRGCKFREVYIEEGYNNMDYINTCVRPMSYNIYILDIDDAAGSIMKPRRFGGRF